jgi:predicted small integral membrane protein
MSIFIGIVATLAAAMLVWELHDAEQERRRLRRERARRVYGDRAGDET